MDLLQELVKGFDYYSNDDDNADICCHLTDDVTDNISGVGLSQALVKDNFYNVHGGSCDIL